MPDPYSKWLDAGEARAPFLAFVAIACQSDIMMRLNLDHGHRLAHDALIVLEGIESAPATPQTIAAAAIVKGRPGTWQRYIRGSSGPDAEDRTPNTDRHFGGTGSTDPGNRDAACDALKDFPQVRASSAGFLFNTARTLGSHGLLRLGPPMDMVFALGSARVAARASTGRTYGGVVLPRNHCLEIIDTVQDWSRAADRNALIVPRYPGHGSLVSRVLAMAIDAKTCADLALELPDGSARAGFGMWEVAEEYHAYALMLFNNGRLDSMMFDSALAFASAAGRLAERAISDPDASLPELPDCTEVATPKRVLMYARSMTGGSFSPRRSAIAAPVAPSAKIERASVAAGGSQCGLASGRFSSLGRQAKRRKGRKAGESANDAPPWLAASDGRKKSGYCNFGAQARAFRPGTAFSPSFLLGDTMNPGEVLANSP